MFSAARRRLTWANVAMTLALVFAMSGGAYAAKKYLIASTKQISPNVLKQLRGAKGPAGPAGEKGATGANGKDGANGTNGTNGANGESVSSAEVKVGEAACAKLGGSSFTVGGKDTFACNGKEGKAGVNGTSVTNTPLTKGNANCEEGGTEFKVGSGTATYACNGSPWTAGGTLPKGAVEEGAWNASGKPVVARGGEYLPAPISFTIPLAAGLSFKEAEPENNRVHIIAPGGKGEGKFEAGVSGKDGLATGCPTTSEAGQPEAESGNLCIFEAFASNVKSVQTVSLSSTIGQGAGTWGTLFFLFPETAGEQIIALGTWAVKG